MSTTTISLSMPMLAIKLERNLLLMLAVAMIGLALTAVMLPLFDQDAITALSLLG